MPTLILSMDGLVLKEIELEKDRVTIGRKPSNDVQIENSAISGEHAVITTIRGDSFLEDLDSTNGTMVNGRNVKRHALRHDDLIEIGKYKLKFLNEKTDLNLPDDEGKGSLFTQSQISEFVPAPTDTLIKGLNTTGFGSAYGTINPALGALRIISGPKTGMELPLGKTGLTLGKTGLQVARIERNSQGYSISHVEGKAIVINDRSYGAQEKHFLRHLDQIEIQGVKMLFVIGVIKKR